MSLMLPNARESARIDAVFRTVAARYPDCVALRDDDHILRYRELDVLTDKLAGDIRARGLSEGALIGIALPRGLAAIIAILATLKARCAYLPLDRDVDDAALACIQAQFSPAQKGDGLMPRLNMSTAVAPPIVPGDPAALAYVMFTSGTTGRPKGVMIPHRAVLRLFQTPDYVTLGPGTVVAQTAPLAFDASTFEIWAALLTGGCLAIHTQSVLDPDRLERFLTKNAVSVLWLTAGLFHTFARHRPQMFSRLRTLLSGGDVVRATRVRDVMTACPELQVVNGYGPTENTTFTTCYTIRPGESVPELLPIGKPVSDTRVFVVDTDLCTVPDNTEGELVCAGTGLALGYVHENIVSNAFVKAPWDSSLRLYRTGDRATRDACGLLYFRGRSDELVKIRGYRVDLRAVRAVLLKQEGVTEALVAMEPSEGGNRLIAHVETATPMTQPALRRLLSGCLPRYAIPDRITPVAKLPLTHNGKLDRHTSLQMKGC